MTLKIGDQPLLLQFSVWACVSVFGSSFLAIFVAWLLMNMKIAALTDMTEMRVYKFWERMGRHDSGFNKRFFFRPELRLVRRFAYGAWTGAFLSFGALMLLIALFGERTPH